MVIQSTDICMMTVNAKDVCGDFAALLKWKCDWNMQSDMKYEDYAKWQLVLREQCVCKRVSLSKMNECKMTSHEIGFEEVCNVVELKKRVSTKRSSRLLMGMGQIILSQVMAISIRVWGTKSANSG